MMTLRVFLTIDEFFSTDLRDPCVMIIQIYQLGHKNGYDSF